MNIYVHELRAGLKSALMWLLALCGVAGMFLAFFPILQKDMQNFLAMLDNFPPAMKAILGVVVEHFKTPTGYYSFIYTYMALFGAIEAAILGVGIVSKEERERTADFLLTKPAARTTVLSAKLCAALTVFIAVDLMYTGVSAGLLALVAEGMFDGAKFLLMNVSILCIQLVFFAIGLALSLVLRRVRSVLPLSLGMVFFFYAISAFAVTAEDDKLRFLTPFQYFTADYLLENGRYEIPYAVTALVIVAVGVTASYMLYRRREIHAV